MVLSRCDPLHLCVNNAAFGTSFEPAANLDAIDAIDDFANLGQQPAGDIFERWNLQTSNIIEVLVIDAALDLGNRVFNLIEIVRPAVARVRRTLHVHAYGKRMAVQTRIGRCLVRGFEGKLFERF